MNFSASLRHYGIPPRLSQTIGNILYNSPNLADSRVVVTYFRNGIERMLCLLRPFGGSLHVYGWHHPYYWKRQ